MNPDTSYASSGWAGRLSVSRQWALLLAFSAVGGGLLTLLGMPAALLLGPTAAGIVLTAGGAKLEVPVSAFAMAQALVGCMIAGMLAGWHPGQEASHLPLLVLGVLSVLAVSGLLGWLMMRLRVLPGTTALWGMSPGAATAMIVLAEDYGADGKMVAFMQYLRVLLVAGAASLTARLMGVGTHAAVGHAAWFGHVAWLPFGETLALAVAGIVAGKLFNLRAGALLIPMVAGIFLTHGGWMTMELPRWLLALCYAVVGWRVGLGFTRPLLLHCAQAFPRVLLCTLGLIVICAGLAGLLVLFAGIDPLTAYLAMSPGGADTVAIIASSGNVDMSFVMAMQMTRFLAILVLGPVVVKLLVRMAGAERERSS